MDWYPDDVVIWPTPSALEQKVTDHIQDTTYLDVWSGNADTDKAWRNR